MLYEVLGKPNIKHGMSREDKLSKEVNLVRKYLEKPLRI